MSHTRSCPTEDEARERGREDRRRGYDSPYAMGGCYEAQEAYDEGVRNERRAEACRREQREREEYEMQQAFYDAEQRQQEESQLEEQIGAQSQPDDDIPF